MDVPVLFFDLDGTLTDSGPGIANSVAYALKHFGISVGDRRELYPFIGPALMDSFMEYCGFSREQALEAIKKYREYFVEKGMFENAVYPGIPELLAGLKKQGRRLAVATSKPEVFAQQILEHFGLSGYFQTITGSCLDGSRSQKAEVIACTLERLGLGAGADVLMIGDRRQDIEGARACGLPAAGVLYGYGSAEELTQAGALYLVRDVAELGQLLLTGQNR